MWGMGGETMLYGHEVKVPALRFPFGLRFGRECVGREMCLNRTISPIALPP